MALEECSLCDLGFRGSKYTWNNGRSDSSFTKECLDCAVTNRELCSVLATRSSDHKPVLVAFHEEVRDKRTRKRVYKFEASWRVDVECIDVIQRALEDHDNDGNPIHSILNILDNYQSDLTGWSRRKFGNVEENLKKK